jgi:predicted Zn-dependent protease
MTFNKGQQEASMILYARISYEMGYNDEALRQLNNLIKTFPGSQYTDEANTMISGLLVKTNDYEEALKHTAAVLRHHPNYVPALRTAMACHALRGNIEGAEKLWRQVALLSPSDRVSETRKRALYRDQDIAKLQKAYRLAGMPE